MIKKQYSYNRSFEAMKDNICDTSYGLCSAPMDAQQALDILTDYLLGENWYVAASLNTEQCNATIVEQILDKYSHQWRRDWRHFEKEDLT